MNFDFTNALFGLAGGILIGLSASLLLLANGRIAGISGITGSLVALKLPAAWTESLVFLAGLVAAPALYALLIAPPAITITGSVPLLIAGGVLVGIGSRLGSGCTSGHGVCGMSRLSKRSILATLTFMGVAIAVVTASRTLMAG
ncbi:YeeE/YedE thiosulfate transporter family protein [Anderseniella sp. Alg231-50]|uniref:YeeE/YedE thiosulfate transporter family protein n=1 Tax=Anderseniella sp. Alg231-50 TaxID=1922226 RepID=UPI000D54FB30